MNRETKRKFKKIKSFFDPNLINELGKSSNFIQRKSKLTALAFMLPRWRMPVYRR